MSLLIGLIVLVVLCGIGFNYLLFMRARAQYAADAMALTLANKINSIDRVGELNQMQEASRELIFVSRQNSLQCDNTTQTGWVSVCNQLVDEARSGHDLVEQERQNQIRTITKETQDAVVAYNHERNKGSEFAFYGLQTFEPEILRVDLGRIAKVNSNVRNLDSIEELTTFDQSKSYFDKSTKLYKCELNAKLPEPDTDLDFNLSSLPAYVDRTDAPSRNTNAQVFMPYATVFSDGETRSASIKHIPSAIQIHYGMDVILPWEQSKIVPLRLVATASASGASFDSE